jgi:hypothetical protein
MGLHRVWSWAVLDCRWGYQLRRMHRVQRRDILDPTSRWNGE